MDFQMETDVRMEFQKEIQEFLGSLGIEIKGTVKHTDILDAMAMDDLQSFSDGFDGQGAYRLFASTHTEGASVEASTGGFQLHEGLVPIEEFALLGRSQLVESQHSSQSVVLILAFCIQPA